MEPQPPPLPVWYPLADPREAHHAALRAWRHVATGSVLLALWFPDERQAGAGVTGWELRHPCGWHERLCVARRSMRAVLNAAEEEIEQARMAGWLKVGQDGERT